MRGYARDPCLDSETEEVEGVKILSDQLKASLETQKLMRLEIEAQARGDEFCPTCGGLWEGARHTLHTHPDFGGWHE